MDGCGVELSMVEVRLHDGRCEHCALDWDERVRGWRFGRPDADLEEHFAVARASGQPRPSRAAPRPPRP